MMTTALQDLLDSREGRTALCIEETITNVTELLARHLTESGMSRSDLADAIGVSPGRVTQLLDGRANLTLASIAKALAAFNRVLAVTSVPVSRCSFARRDIPHGQPASSSLITRSVPPTADCSSRAETPLALAA